MQHLGWQTPYEDFADALIQQSGIPAAAVAIAQDGNVVYERGFGHPDAARSLPVTADTRFGLGSVTKSFPCLAIMQLDEAGTVSVDDPVVRWLPEFRFPRPEDADRASHVTVHNLMTHSSGLPLEPALLHARAASICADPDLDRMHPRPMSVPADIRQWEQITTYDDLMALMARQSFAALGDPGEIISYSNEGFVLLAAIVERATGQPFPTYLQQHVLDPLKLTRTGLYTRATPPQPPEVIPFAVDVTSGTREVFPSPAWWDQGTMYGNGGLKSTTHDLLRYLEIYRTGGLGHGQRVLSAAGIARMTTPHQPIPIGNAYGYGLKVSQVPGLGKSVEHGGGNKGVATHVVVLPEHNLTAVALTNLAEAPADKLAYGLVNAFLDRAPETPWADYPEHQIAPSTLQRYVGTYQGQPGVTAHVTTHDGRLYLATNGEPQPARPFAEGAFLVETTGEAIRFLERPQGTVWAMFSGLRTLPRIQ